MLVGVAAIVVATSIPRMEEASPNSFKKFPNKIEMFPESLENENRIKS